MTDSYLCDNAKLDWQNEAPYSTLYQDIYWHRAGALQEKQHVFIDPLMKQTGKCRGSQQVTVCELGFGFGINCLLAAEHWRSMPLDCRLNLVSIERHPVTPTALARCLHLHNFAHADILQQQYPPPYRGQHVIWLASNIRLVLVLDDVDSALANLDAEADFWFLDGFAPRRNDAMWQSSLYRKMFARSRPGAGVATYTAAGQVRRGLEKAGFLVRKKPGFGGKKEMLQATVPGEWQPGRHLLTDVSIIGAGLAGLYCAEALQRRSVEPRIIDGGTGASGIPQLAVKPQLAVQAEARYRYSLLAYQYMKTSPGYHHSGLRWLTGENRDSERLQKISGQFPDTIMKPGADGSIDVSEAGWLSYAELREQLALPVTSDEIQDLQATRSDWLLRGNKRDYQAQHVILATGSGRALLPTELQVRAIHGQAISIASKAVEQVINGDVSILPTHEGRSVVSGTYARRDSLDADPEDTRLLLESAAALLPFTPECIETHTGVRAVSRDRLPIVGAAPDWEQLGEARRVNDISDYISGLYFCTAFGSRGATHARLSAEHLVAKLFGEPGAIDLKQQRMLSPARFFIRDRSA